MNTDILEIIKNIVKDFINCFDDTNYYVSPGPLSLNLTLAVDVNDMKDQACLFQKGHIVPANI